MYGPSKVELPPINDIDLWVEYLKNHKPLFTQMISFDQANIKHILRLLYMEMEYETQKEYTNSTNISSSILSLYGKDRWMGYWLFAALHCLEMPCSPNILATLRDITRICIKWRSLLSKEESNMACYYNMFIYFVAKYFKQADLMDFV